MKNTHGEEACGNPDFCIAIKCESFKRKRLFRAARCAAKLEPWDCEDIMNEEEARLYHDYLEKEQEG